MSAASAIGYDGVNGAREAARRARTRRSVVPCSDRTEASAWGERLRVARRLTSTHVIAGKRLETCRV